jgi:hypothetical protein
MAGSTGGEGASPDAASVLGAVSAKQTTARRHNALDAGVILTLLLILLAVQLRAGAFTAELVHADEPAHFISGLLVRDYLASGFTDNPLDFAHAYYAHYPKIAIGNWPPLFYAAQGVWLLLTPAHPGSVRLLMALVTALLVSLVYLLLRRELDRVHAAFGAGLLTLLHPLPAYAGMVMIENMLAMLTTIAVFMWASYMGAPSVRGAVAFAAAAAIAVLTKGNALFLALLPPLSIAFSRRWDLLRSRGLLLAGLLLLLLAGPWLWFFLGDVVTGWKQVVPTAEFMHAALSSHMRSLLRALGVAGSLALLLGMASRATHGRRTGTPGRTIWVAAAATIAAVLLFHVLVPAGIDSRHLIPAYPALAMFVAAGAFAATSWLRGRGVGRATASWLVVGSLSVAVGVESVRLPVRSLSGYRQAAAAVLDHAGASPVTALIVAGAGGEGAFIVEMAVRDRSRPSHTIWRGSRLLSMSTWAGRDYRLRTDDDAAVLTLLDQAAIRYVVLDRGASRLPHQQQLARVIDSGSTRFTPVLEVPLRRHGESHPVAVLSVFEFVSAPGERGVRVPTIHQVPAYHGIEAVSAVAPPVGPPTGVTRPPQN